MNFVTLATIVGQTVVIIPRYSGQVLRLGATEVVTVAGEPARVYGTGTVEISQGFWDLATVVDGEYFGPPFDGNTWRVTVEGSVMFTEWDGGVNGSESRAVSAPAAVTLDVERSVDGSIWEPWLVGVAADVLQHFTDRESLSRGVTFYRVTAWAASGAASVVVYEIVSDSTAVWLSGGSGLGVTARLPFDPKIAISPSRARTRKRYAGRELPVAYAGEAIGRTVQVNGRITDHALSGEETANVDALTQLAQAVEPVFMFRDPDGRRIYGDIGDMPMSRDLVTAHESGWNAIWGYSFTLTETEKE